MMRIFLPKEDYYVLIDKGTAAWSTSSPNRYRSPPQSI